MMNFLRNKIQTVRTVRLNRTSPYRDQLADIPASLFPYWQQTAAHEFQGIPSDAFFFARAAEGLLTFFECICLSTAPCGLPSTAADSVWHAWIDHDPEGLDRFCLKHVGRTIVHTPAGSMGLPMEDALANTLVKARRLQGLPRAGARLPGLFTLDKRLKMPGGYAYHMSNGRVAFSVMNLKGKPAGLTFYPSTLDPVQLLAAGLITQIEFDEQAEAMKAASSGCGSVLIGDGGGDGGGSDGGGCGGGCG